MSSGDGMGRAVHEAMKPGVCSACAGRSVVCAVEALRALATIGP